MVDPAFSRQRYEEDRAARNIRRRRSIAPLLAVIVLIGGGVSLVWAFAGTAPPPGVAPSPISDRVSDELMEKTKALAVTQQQAVDQLKTVQDQLARSQSETKKLSEQLVTVTGKLDAIQSSVAGIAARSPP